MLRMFILFMIYIWYMIEKHDLCLYILVYDLHLIYDKVVCTYIYSVYIVQSYRM
jgi:hypothetical protein